MTPKEARELTLKNLGGDTQKELQGIYELIARMAKVGLFQLTIEDRYVTFSAIEKLKEDGYKVTQRFPFSTGMYMVTEIFW